MDMLNAKGLVKAAESKIPRKTLRMMKLKMGKRRGMKRGRKSQKAGAAGVDDLIATGALVLASSAYNRSKSGKSYTPYKGKTYRRRTFNRRR